MKVIGITGGVGCGKTTVLRLLLERCHARVILADDVAKELMQKGQRVYNQIVDELGREILLENGDLNRRKLAEIIFCDSKRRMALNHIVHPAVKKHIVEEVADCRARQQYDYVFIEAALLIEDHYETICEEFWYVHANTQVRRKRLKESRGYTDERIDAMLQSQLSEEEFKKACRVVIDNSNDLEHTIAQIEKILEE